MNLRQDDAAAQRWLEDFSRGEVQENGPIKPLVDYTNRPPHQYSTTNIVRSGGIGSDEVAVGTPLIGNAILVGRAQTKDGGALESTTALLEQLARRLIDVGKLDELAPEQLAQMLDESAEDLGINNQGLSCNALVGTPDGFVTFQQGNDPVYMLSQTDGLRKIDGFGMQSGRLNPDEILVSSGFSLAPQREQLAEAAFVRATHGGNTHGGKTRRTLMEIVAGSTKVPNNRNRIATWSYMVSPKPE